MNSPHCRLRILGSLILFLHPFSVCPTFGQADDPRIDQLISENRRLQEQVRDQQKQIDQLGAKIAELVRGRETADRSLPSLKDELPAPDGRSEIGRFFDKMRISGEGGVGFFRTGSNGQYPDSAFRVDEAKLFIEAPIWKRLYVFAELDITTREANDEFFHLGEFYLDFEDVSLLWGHERLLNLRAGRFDIPFGEEYETRDVIDNPLISHSLPDIWGVDEGLALYGSAGKVQYIVATQNGGRPTLNDFTSDKAVVGRISVDPLNWLHLSGSAMRTGNLDVENDEMSELWFGNGFIRGLGPSASTDEFHANLFEIDGRARWSSGHVHLAAGYIDFDDNDRLADNHRDVFYYYAEAVQNLTRKLYGAARFSEIRADEGFPIVAHGDFGRYFFGPLTRAARRLSLGVGYRFSPNLVLKGEYTFDQAELEGGGGRNHENLLGLEVGMKF